MDNENMDNNEKILENNDDKNGAINLEKDEQTNGLNSNITPNKKEKKKKWIIIMLIILLILLSGIVVWKISFNKKGKDTNIPIVDNKGQEAFIHFSENSLLMKTNDEYNLKDIMRLENVDIQKLSFESNDDNIVSIEQQKLISKNNVGSATITAKYNNLETKLLVIVENDEKDSLVYSADIKQSEYYLFVGETLNVDYEYHPTYASDIDFSWLSSDSDIVSTNNNKITGNKIGKATITLKNNKTGCNVDEDYDCYDTSNATVYVVNHKIVFEYLDNNEYKKSYEISDSGHSDYIHKLYETEDYDGVQKAKYTKDYYIRVTLSNLDNVIYTSDDLKMSTKNTGATNVAYSYIGKDEKIENAYLYKVTYTFDESKANSENHSDTTFTLPDGSTSIFRMYSEEAYYCYNACKPVLYLYPLKTTNVSVNLKFPSYITTSYPKYNNGWSIKVDPSGNITDVFGKSYYALYWDEKYYTSKENGVDFKTGFYVESENATEFLEEKLSYIGLNDRERNEFIMYWLPILEKNGKSLVYFELTKERELNNKLNISPIPDSLLRVVIHVKKVDKKVNIKEQKLIPFNRYGFTAIEWGGVNH